MKTLHIDFETYSGVDLKKVGVENYLRHPDFAVTVIAWAFDDGPVQSRAYPNCSLPPEVRAHIHEGGIVKAWNAAFEWNVLEYLYGANATHEQMDCVMQRALAYGLPGSLQLCGEALKAGIIKDATARKNMLAMGKPRKGNPVPWHMDPAGAQKLADLEAYCRRDVEAERALDKMIKPLHSHEKKLSVIDARINQKGVPIDLVGATDLMNAAAFEIGQINAECERLTGGAVKSPGTERDKLLAWLQTCEGVLIPDLTKETVAQYLNGPLSPKARRVLELRQLSAKASVAKLAMMIGWASVHDGRARNGLQFYGAGRTGRWAGRGIQVQNMPRPPKDWNPQKVMDLAHASPGALRLFYPQPMKAISSSLRGCLTARPEYVLLSIDLSQIEARVGAWLAGQDSILAACRAYDAGTGPDIYVYAAAQQGSTDRQFGKVFVAGVPVRHGRGSFSDDGGGLWRDADEAEAKTAIDKWRAQHQAIKFMWWDLENMALALLGHPNPRIKRQFWTLRNGIASYRGIRMKIIDGVLVVKKPNDCNLYYQRPHVKLSDDKGRDSLKFYGVISPSNKWDVDKLYGGRLFENLVQSIARDVMAEAIVRVEEEVGILPVMTVHDEIVWEVPERASLTAQGLQNIVNDTPSWASGLPVASDVKMSWRYSK